MLKARLCALFLALPGWSTTSLAAIYSVGSGTGCTHSTVQAALNAAASDPSSTQHLIKLPSGQMLVADLTLANPVTTISIEGGYPTCTASSPTGVTTLRRDPSVSVARILSISNNASRRVSVALSRLTLTDGVSNSALGGGGLYITGRINVLIGERVRIENNQSRTGGGISIGALTLPENGPALVFSGDYDTNSQPKIRNNLATLDGGGIYAWGGATIIASGIEISGNVARRHGGGIAAVGGIQGSSIHLQNLGVTFSEISNNVAGTSGFSTTSGFGGGVYLQHWDFQQEAGSYPIPQLALSNNTANLGGGMYVDGSTDGRRTVKLTSAAVNGNTALARGGAFYLRNGVQLEMSHKEDGGWCLALIIPVRCSGLNSNTAQNQGGAGATGAGAALYMEADADTPDSATPIANIYRTNISGNDDAGGAVFHVGNKARLNIEASLLRDNKATGVYPVLVHNESGMRLTVRYNTILANDIERLFYTIAQPVDLQGSIVWDPGKMLAWLVDGAYIYQAGCLISHPNPQVVPEKGVYTVNPRLDSQGRPRGSSPALDVCDNLNHTPIRDIAYQERDRDVPGVERVWGNHDLGMFENHDILFYGGFGQRPSN